MKLEHDLILITFRIGLLLFFFNGFSHQTHPLIKYYDGDLKLTEKQVDSLVIQTLEDGQSNYLLALAHYQKGVLKRRNGEDIGAFESYESALEFLQKADTTDYYLLSATWMNQGVILRNYKLHQEAVALYQKALKPAYKFSMNQGYNTEYNMAYSMMEYDPKSALAIFFDLKNKATNDLNRQARICNQLGLFQKNVEQYDQALSYYKEGLSLEPNERIKANLLQNIAVVYYHQQDYRNQESYLLQVLKTPKANRFIALMDLGECYLLQGQDKEALKYLQEAEALYDEQPLKREHINVFKWLQMVSDDPVFYANRQVEELAKYIDRMDELKEMMETLAMRNLLVAVEADMMRKEATSFYRVVSIILGVVALIILLTWKIWWLWLQKGVEKEILRFRRG